MADPGVRQPIFWQICQKSITRRMRTARSSLHQAPPPTGARPPGPGTPPEAGTPPEQAHPRSRNPPGPRTPQEHGPPRSRHPPVDRHIPVNILPCPKLRLRAVKMKEIGPNGGGRGRIRSTPLDPSMEFMFSSLKYTEHHTARIEKRTLVRMKSMLKRLSCLLVVHELSEWFKVNFLLNILEISIHMR